MTTHYDVLGVPRSASDEAIRAAFHSAAKACHPDLNAGDPVAEQKLKQIIDAYDVLKSAERRAAYDELLTEGRRALARRLATSAVATLAGGAVVVLGVSLLSSQPYQHVASAPASSALPTEWERAEASGDSKASAPSSHSNASEAIKVVGREEPQEPVGVTTKAAAHEEPAAQDLTGATITTVVREEPAAQNSETAVTTKVAIREEPAAQELEGDTKIGREEPAARKLTPATAVKRLARGHDPARPATAEIRSPALFGVAF